MIPITRPELPPLEDYQALLAEIWESRMLSNFGRFARELEELTTGYLTVPTKVVVSGDIGLVLTLAALDLPKGSRVVAPSFTFSSTINAIAWNGLEPVFADIDLATFNLDPSSAEEALSRYGARAIVATHVFGNPADVDGLTDVAKRHGARLVFDAAHAYGALRDGRHVGSFGDAEVFSLSGTKLVTTAEGGLISTSSLELLERISYLRGYGFLGDYNSLYIGLNGKLSELHAALGTLTMARVEEAIAARRALIDIYQPALDGASLAMQSVRRTDRATFKDLALLFRTEEARASVERVLTDNLVQTKRYFLPAHRQHAYQGLSRVSLARTDEVHARLLCVPLYESLLPAQIQDIAGLIRHSLR